MYSRRKVAILAGCLLADSAFASDAFRTPFDLHLEIDEGRYYEQHFEHTPYVAEDAVYLFKGDEFGVKLSTGSSGSTVVEYQANLDKSDVTFKLSQMADKTGRAMMVLVIRNRTGRELDMKALMTVPGEKGIFPTTIASVQAGLTGYESWPHPIVQLYLSSFRLR